MKIRIYIPIILLFVFFGCVKKKKTRLFNPIAIVEKEGIKIKVFDFDNFKPLLQIHNDTTYVINFWATWCKPCVKELPYFEMLDKLYKSKKVKVLLVSLDMESHIESKLIPFVKKKRLETQVVVLDDVNANSWIPKIAEDWTGAIPATIIYNKRKKMFYERSFTYKELEKQLNNIL